MELMKGNTSKCDGFVDSTTLHPPSPSIPTHITKGNCRSLTDVFHSPTILTQKLCFDQYFSHTLITLETITASWHPSSSCIPLGHTREKRYATRNSSYLSCLYLDIQCYIYILQAKQKHYMKGSSQYVCLMLAHTVQRKCDYTVHH